MSVVTRSILQGPNEGKFLKELNSETKFVLAPPRGGFTGFVDTYEPASQKVVTTTSARRRSMTGPILKSIL